MKKHIFPRFLTLFLVLMTLSVCATCTFFNEKFVIVHN